MNKKSTNEKKPHPWQKLYEEMLLKLRAHIIEKQITGSSTVTRRFLLAANSYN